MGILNASPDSFANGGQAATADAGRAMIAHGADILDIGGESTRPGAEPGHRPAKNKPASCPIIEALAGHGAAISIDTRNAATMRAAPGRRCHHRQRRQRPDAYDPDAASIVAAVWLPRRADAHARHAADHDAPDAVQRCRCRDVIDELAARIEAAECAGIAAPTSSSTQASALPKHPRRTSNCSAARRIRRPGPAHPRRRVPQILHRRLWRRAGPAAPRARLHRRRPVRAGRAPRSCACMTWRRHVQAVRVWTALRESGKGGSKARGSAPGPRWGLRPQTPIRQAHGPLAYSCPPLPEG